LLNLLPSSFSAPLTRNVVALEKDLKNWAKNWNKDPKPFVWRKTADEILDSLGRYCSTISDSGH
jgi:hypothetical protein